MIIHYIVEENTFVIIFYMPSFKKNFILSYKDWFEINSKPECLRNVNILNSKMLKEK